MKMPPRSGVFVTFMLLLSCLCARLHAEPQAAAPVPAPAAPSAPATPPRASIVVDIKHLTPDEGKKLLAANQKDVAAKKAEPIVILDVRTPQEFASEKIAGAQNLDFRGADFEKELAKLDRTKPYFLHCRSGGRSASSLEVMKLLGFTKVFHLDGGLEAWKKAGLPTEKTP